jgi:hypothetical protein
MRYYHPFERSGESYEARVGQPDAVSAALGQVVLQFAALDAELSQTLRGLLEGDEGWSQLLTAALPFAEKLAFLDERVRLLPPTRAFNAGTIGPLELFAELHAQCARAAQLHAEVLAPEQVKHARRHSITLQCAAGRDRACGRPWRRPPPSWTSPTSSVVSPRTCASSSCRATGTPPPPDPRPPHDSLALRPARGAGEDARRRTRRGNRRRPLGRRLAGPGRGRRGHRRRPW